MKLTYLPHILLPLALTSAPQVTYGVIGIYVSPPGDTTSSMANVSAEEDFEDAPATWTGSTEFTTAIGTYTQLSGTVEKLGGGAGDPQFGIDDSSYLALAPSAELELQLNSPVQYLGFAWPAGDPDNRIRVYNGDTLLFTLDTSDIVDFLPSSSTSTVTSVNGDVYNTEDYYGQPAFETTGGNGKGKGKGGDPETVLVDRADRLNNNEPYAFIHIIASEGDTFDRIVFEHTRDSGKFETDNHAIIDFGDSVTPNGDFVLVFDDAGTQLPEPMAYPLVLGLWTIGLAALRRCPRP